MPIIQLDFLNPLNTSVQVGDMVYFTNPSPVPGTLPHVHGVQPPPHDTSNQENIILIGVIIPFGIIPFDGTTSSIQCDMAQVLFNKYSNQISVPGSFIMFSKDNKVNQLDVLGYYAAIEYKNNSTEEAELFNIGATYFDSSK